MKKKLLTLSLMFVFMFIININRVEGVTCEYGIKETDNDTWEHKITLDVENYNIISFDAKNSPMFNNFMWDENGFMNDVHEKNDSNFIYRYQISAPNDPDGHDDYYIYASLFATEDAYNQANGECPTSLKYSFTRKEVVGVENDDVFTMSIYADDLAKQKIIYDDVESKNQKENSDVASGFGFSKTSGYLILESEKEKLLNEVIDVYGCSTYSIYYLSMANAKNSSEKGCDSREFTDTYTELQDLCTAYRSTDSYANVSDDNVTISACQTACTNLKDDVAQLCKLEDTGGYCGSISSDVVTYIFKIFGIVRYIVPALLVILSVLEYIKAIASDSDDEMKKVSGRFVKRLLAAALIILIPLVIDFVLGLFDIPGLSANKPFCN